MEYFISVVKDNYANFNGRARRQEYWMFYLFYSIIYTVLLLIESSLGTGEVLTGLYFLALLIPVIAVNVRRLHDTGTSGHMLWINLTVIGSFWILFLLCKASDEGQNKYDIQ